MGDVEAKLSRERIPKCAGMPFRGPDADKDFAVLKREHVGRTRLMHKFPMQRSHSSIRNEPHENLIQFSQIGRFSNLQPQTAAQRFRREYLEIRHFDRDLSLTIVHEDVRSRHSERSEESQIVSGGQSQTIIRGVLLRSESHESCRRSLLRLKVARD